jgi:hypothetical protein
VALLDCTVKVFFLDSLKFFLSLYGHKLPVSSCMSCQKVSNRSSHKPCLRCGQCHDSTLENPSCLTTDRQHVCSMCGVNSSENRAFQPFALLSSAWQVLN